MGVARSIDITTEQRNTLLALLERHLPDTEAWIYGSRIKWTSRPQSDLDMVVFATPGQVHGVSNLREAFEDSSLPFRVDLFVWNDVPDSFRSQIAQEHVVLTEPQACVGGWPDASLGECIILNDATYSPQDKWPFVNYLDTGNITDNRIEAFQFLDLNNIDIPSRARRKARSGDIVFSTVRPNQRHFGLLRDLPENFLASTAFAVFSAREDIADTGFVYWFLTQDRIVDQLHTIAEHSTSTYPSIRPADIQGLNIGLPPLHEQRAIAHILGTLDDRIELNRRMNETLEAMARAIFRDWFVDFGPTRAKAEGREPYLAPELWDLFSDALNDEGNPAGWSCCDLRAFAHTNPESWSNTNYPEEIEYVDLANTKWGTIEAIRKIRRSDAPSRAKRVLRPGDTIVGLVRPANGSYAFVGGSGLTGSTGFAALRPHKGSYSALVYLAATAPDNIQRLADLADGAAYPAIRPEVVEETAIAVPDNAMVAKFSELMSPIFKLMVQNTKANNTLAQTRDLLLPKLMSGEIRLAHGETAAKAVE